MVVAKSTAMFNCDENPNDSLGVFVLSDNSVGFDMMIGTNDVETVILSDEDARKIRDFLNENLN